MLKVVFKTPLYKSFRRFGFPKVMPINYTVSVTNRCMSRCKTCNIYENYLEALDLLYELTYDLREPNKIRTEASKAIGVIEGYAPNE